MVAVDPTVQNPVTELRKAAAAIRENARGTAGGPWKARPVWSPDSHVTSAVYSYAYPTGTVESEVVASGLKRYPKGGLRNPCNARWIAMMHPGLAEPLADWLESAAKHAEKCKDPANQAIIADPHALAVARVILGGAE